MRRFTADTAASNRVDTPNTKKITVERRERWGCWLITRLLHAFKPKNCSHRHQTAPDCGPRPFRVPATSELHRHHSHHWAENPIRDVPRYSAVFRRRSGKYPFLEPIMFKSRRKAKPQPKGEKGWYLGPAHIHPRDCVCVLTKAGTVITTRSFNWRHVPAASPAPPQLMPLADEEEGGEGESRESASRQSVQDIRRA